MSLPAAGQRNNLNALSRLRPHLRLEIITSEKTAPNHRLQSIVSQQTHYFGPSTLCSGPLFLNHGGLLDCLHRINARKIPDKMTRA